MIEFKSIVIMKRLLCMCLTAMLAIAMACGQTISKEELIEAITGSDVEEAMRASEQQMAANGIKMKGEMFFDNKLGCIVVKFRFFDKQIYDQLDVEAGARGGIEGSLREMYDACESDISYFEQIVRAFKRYNINWRYGISYVDKSGQVFSKERTVTPEEIQKIASLLY